MLSAVLSSNSFEVVCWTWIHFWYHSPDFVSRSRYTLIPFFMCLLLALFGPDPGPSGGPLGRLGSFLVALEAWPHNPSWHLDRCLVNEAGPTAPLAVEKKKSLFSDTTPLCVPLSFLARYGCCGSLVPAFAPVSISAWLRYTCAVTHLSGCERIRQLRSRALCEKATSFVELRTRRSSSAERIHSFPTGKMDGAWVRGCCHWWCWQAPPLHPAD